MANKKRLIDANALKIAFKRREMADIDMYGGCHIAECFQGYEANEIVDKMPTVDAVEVVRCKDCKHFWLPQGFCTHDRHEYQTQAVWQEDDDFCSYGERRDAK